MIKSLGFLTLKPMVVAVNVGEDQLGKEFDFISATDGTAQSITICAKLECELTQLDAKTRKEFMADLGITESAAGKFVKNCYNAMGLISFLTIGSDDATRLADKARDHRSRRGRQSAQ